MRFSDFDDVQKERARETYKILREQVRSIADILPEPIATEVRDVMDFRESLSEETDRGSALMAAAYLDDKLKVLLKAKLVDDVKLSRRAFEFNGSLGTFSSRIDFSYLLGLIPKNAHKDLHIIRSIRNKFAHVAAPISFDNVEIKPLCDNLRFHGVLDSVDPGAKFRRSAMGLLTLIIANTNKAEHIVPQTDYSIPDRSIAFEMVSNLWAQASDGLPYPVEHHHVQSPSEDDAPNSPRSEDGESSKENAKDIQNGPGDPV